MSGARGRPISPCSSTMLGFKKSRTSVRGVDELHYPEILFRAN